MSKTTLKFIVEAMSPISQAEGVQGNHSVLMMRKQRLADGTIERIPIVSSDSMRHGLRECGAEICLGLAGLLDRPEGQLTESALRLLYSGGMLTGRGDASVVKIDRWREVCETLPILSLMGGCIDAMMIPGKMQVGDLVLLCSETAGDAYHPWRDQMDHVQRVRFDVTRDPHKQRLLSDGARAIVDHRLLGKETARAAGDTATEDRGRPMPHSHEVICAGSLWSWELTHNTLTDVEAATLNLSLALFFHSWCIGGKRGTGHGRIRAVKAESVSLPRFCELKTECDVSSLSVSGKTLLETHMQARKDALCDLLAKVDA